MLDTAADIRTTVGVLPGIVDRSRYASSWEEHMCWVMKNYNIDFVTIKKRGKEWWLQISDSCGWETQKGNGNKLVLQWHLKEVMNLIRWTKHKASMQAAVNQKKASLSAEMTERKDGSTIDLSDIYALTFNNFRNCMILGRVATRSTLMIFTASCVFTKNHRANTNNRYRHFSVNWL